MKFIPICIFFLNFSCNCPLEENINSLVYALSGPVGHLLYYMLFFHKLEKMEENIVGSVTKPRN